MTTTQPTLISIPDAAKELGLKDSTLYGIIGTKDGPAYVRIGQRKYLRRQDLNTWLERMTVTNQTPPRPRPVLIDPWQGTETELPA